MHALLFQVVCCCMGLLAQSSPFNIMPYNAIALYLWEVLTFLIALYNIGR